MGVAQLENGFTRIADELLEALAAHPIPGRHLRVALALVRLTYGWHKARDRIAVSQLATATGLDGRDVRRLLADLVEWGVVERREPGPGRIAVLGIDKHVDRWRVRGYTPGAGARGAGSRGAGARGRGHPGHEDPGTPGAGARGTPGAGAPHQRQMKDILQRESEAPRTAPAGEGGTATDPQRWAPLVAGRWFAGDRRAAARWLADVLPELEALARAEVAEKGGTFRDRLAALIHRYARNRDRIEGRRPARVPPVRDWAARRAAAEGGDR